MKTDKLYRIADGAGIKVERTDLPLNRSVSVQMDNRSFIGLDQRLSHAEERVCLAHELGHCETMSFYNFYSPLDIRAKHENRANGWAIKKLIPKRAFQNALRNGYRDIFSLAEYFEVTEDFMQKAVEFYQLKATS